MSSLLSPELAEFRTDLVFPSFGSSIIIRENIRASSSADRNNTRDVTSSEGGEIRQTKGTKIACLFAQESDLPELTTTLSSVAAFLVESLSSLRSGVIRSNAPRRGSGGGGPV